MGQEITNKTLMNEVMLRQKTHFGVLGKHRKEPENELKNKTKQKTKGSWKMQQFFLS